LNRRGEKISLVKSLATAVKKISVIIPCFNEEEVLPQLFQRLTSVAGTWAMDYEIICVDDGSRDRTWELLKQQNAKDSRWRCLSFARNFGHQVAVSAGLYHATGDAVVIIDADLQDPPEQISLLLEKWREGFQVVYAVRTKREAVDASCRHCDHVAQAGGDRDLAITVIAPSLHCPVLLKREAVGITEGETNHVEQILRRFAGSRADAPDRDGAIRTQSDTHPKTTRHRHGVGQIGRRRHLAAVGLSPMDHAGIRQNRERVVIGDRQDLAIGAEPVRGPLDHLVGGLTLP